MNFLATLRPDTLIFGLLLLKPFIFIIGTRSWLLLKALQAAGNWLSVDLDGRGDGNGHKMTEFLKDLKVVNDLAKRCIKEIVLRIILLMEKIYMA